MKKYLNFLENNLKEKQIKYTVLTFLFGYYDILKEPDETDENAEYICVTDRRDLTSNVWKFIYDDELIQYNEGIQKSFVVKYKKLFSYISPESKYVIRLDASIKIYKSLKPVIKYIDDYEYDCALMIHPERRNLIDEYNRWITLRNQDPKYQNIFINKMHELGFELFDTGLIETTAQIYKICPKIKNMINDISNIIEETNNFYDNNDQCYYTYILSKYIDELNILYINRQFISSDYLDLCFHYTDIPAYENHNDPYSSSDNIVIYDIDNPIKHYNLLGHDISIHFFKNKEQETLGIFYIATGVYKEYFNKFFETIKYIFPNHKKKKLIIISDGLKEYNNKNVNGFDVIVEEFIDYPYPFININKFQIINSYANKHNIDIIVYFDSETYFIEKDNEFFDDLIDKSRKKMISLIPPYFINYTFRDFIWGINNYSNWGQAHNFEDFSFFYKTYDYDTIDTSYKWLQTSFFMCSKDILINVDKILQSMISYNLRVMGCKLNFSDEFYINYLNRYYDDIFYGDYYCDDKEYINKFSSKFFYQKTFTLQKKMTRKFGNVNYNFKMIMFRISSEDKLNKFFMEHHSNFLMISNNCNLKNVKLFYDNILLNDFWFDGNHNVILEKTFYTNTFIKNFKTIANENEHICIGFINEINEYTDNFDYDEFYNGEYDYIEGYGFDDIKNMKFEKITMCCFSRKYIDVYFNNELNTYSPKIYKVNT